MISWRVLLPVFLVALFLIKYYDFFYVYQSVKIFNVGGDYQPTILSFTVYNYLLKVSFYLIKFLFIAAILSGGILLFSGKGDQKSTTIGELYTLAMTCEFIFLLADVFKILDFTFISTNYQYQDYLNYYPLSLFQILETDPDSLFSDLLQSLNVFEVIYIVSLGYGLKNLQLQNNNMGYKVVIFSYGSILIIWIFIITFIKSL